MHPYSTSTPLNSPPPAPEDALPFTVRIATAEPDFQRLCRLRSEVYRSHEYTPYVVQALATMNEADHAAFLLVAEEKGTGNIVGTMRVSSSLQGPAPLLPGMPTGELGTDSYTYLDRFAVSSTPFADITALALVKAQWHIALHEGVQWVIASAMAPLVRNYRRFGFRALQGADEGFYCPQLHSAKYYAVGENVATISESMIKTSPLLAEFILADLPDVQIKTPPEVLALRARFPG